MKFLFIFLLLITSCTSSKKHRAPSTTKSPYSILHFGDSHSVGPFGKLMYENYQLNFEEVNLYAIRGSSPFHWTPVKTDKICSSAKKGRHNLQSPISLRSKVCNQGTGRIAKKLLARHQPKYVVFQFLGNSIPRKATKDTAEYRKWVGQDVSRLLKLLSGDQGGQKCIFITSPPYYKSKHIKRRDEYEEIFRTQAIKYNCDVISVIADKNVQMENFKSYYAIDNMHLTESGAKFFANYVIKKLEIILSK